MESILTSIKLLLGIPEEHVYYDPQIIMHINTVFGILCQLGVGPDTPFRINDKSTTWDDFDAQGLSIEEIKTDIYLRVKSFFDPPSNSFTMEALGKQSTELEWRMMINADPSFEEVLENEDKEEGNQNGL